MIVIHMITPMQYILCPYIHGVRAVYSSFPTCLSFVVETLTGGEAKVEVSGGGLPFPYSTTRKLCNLAKKVNITCPIKPGKFPLHLNQNIPSIVPPVSEPLYSLLLEICIQ